MGAFWDGIGDRAGRKPNQANDFHMQRSSRIWLMQLGVALVTDKSGDDASSAGGMGSLPMGRGIMMRDVFCGLKINKKLLNEKNRGHVAAWFFFFFGQPLATQPVSVCGHQCNHHQHQAEGVAM